MNYILKKATIMAAKNADKICTVVAVAGVFATAYFSAKAGAESAHMCDQVWYDKMQETDSEEDLSIKEKVIVSWKNYIPAGITLTLTVLNIVGAYNAANTKYLTALTAAGALGRQYSEKSTGKEKEEKDPEVNLPDKGYFWIYEPLTDQAFKTTTEEVLWVELMVNHLLQNNTLVTLNQVLMHFKNAKCYPIGEDLGWTVDSEMWAYDGYSFYKGLPWIDFDFSQAVHNGRNVLEFGFGVSPVSLHVTI